MGGVKSIEKSNMSNVLQDLDLNKIRDDLYQVAGSFPLIMWGIVIPLVFTLTAFLDIHSYVMKIIEMQKFMSMMEAEENQKDKAEMPIKETSCGLNKEIFLNQLSKIEVNLLSSVINPEHIDVGFSDIAGLEDVIVKIQQRIMIPLLLPYDSNLTPGVISTPKGSLFYGPPGVGKTMLAKALAKESGARFINIDVSQISSKWLGETEKIVTAIFTLARKIQPSIIFIDEIDSLLASRQDLEHRVERNIKALFLQHMDGLLSNNTSRVLVIGATNRKDLIDQAILRRMPITFNIDLPNYEQREVIFQEHLRRLNNVDSNIEIAQLAIQSQGYSSSRIKDICQGASF